ncbi:MAG: M1 family aminopeptidase [Myxococcota bacterium]|nr:M1 family aminopeptidase [Myxococcota bacterium]
MKCCLTLVMLLAYTAHGQERRLVKDFCGLSAPAIEPSQEKRADRVGDYDIISLDVTLSESGAGFYTRASYQIIVFALLSIESEISFFVPGLDVDEVTMRDESGARTPANFRPDSDTGLLYVELDDGLAADAIVTFELTGSLALERVCTGPRNCILEGDYQHLATAGWYPMSDTYATDDRFHIRTSLRESVGSNAVGRTIGIVAPDDEGNVYFQTATRTYLPAVTRGPYSVIQGEAGFEFFAPQDVNRVAFNGALAESRLLYESLFGDMPFAPIQVATISDEARVAIGAQALILVPAGLWRISRDDPFFETVLEILSHELAHQYFFNLVAITDPRDGWLSEGFAEYAATRASEFRTGEQTHIMRNYWAYMLAANGRNDAPVYGLAVRDSPIVYEIMYQKGSSLLEMLRRRLGTQPFDQALLDYTQQFANQIATTAEFETFLVARFPEANIESFFQNWVYLSGFPEMTLRVTRQRLDSGQLTVETSVRVPAGTDGLSEPIPVRIIGNGPPVDTILNADATEQAISLESAAHGLQIDPDITFFRRIYAEPRTDINLNGVVDGMDLLDVTYATNWPTPGLHWDELADVNGDGITDTLDIDEVIDQLGTFNGPR